MTNSEIRSSVKSKIKGSYPKLFGYNAVILAIALITYLPLIIMQTSRKSDALFSVLAFADILALLLILSPPDYICRKSGLKISNGESAEQANPFKLKIEEGRYFKIIALNIWKSIPAILLVIHALAAFASAFALTPPLLIASQSPSLLESIYALIPIFILITFPITLVVTTIKYYSYYVADYIFIEQTDISPLNAIKKSKELMKHNKMRYFKLCLSYYKWMIIPYVLFNIGYTAYMMKDYDATSQLDTSLTNNPLFLIACAVIVVIPTLFISPYLTVASAEFYNELKTANNKESKPPVKPVV